MTKRKTRLNGSNEIARSVDRSLEEYFRRLDGETPTGVYDMVIGHVERALLASIMGCGLRANARSDEAKAPRSESASNSAAIGTNVNGSETRMYVA